MSRKLSVSRALNEELHRLMELSPSLIFLGQDIGRFGGRRLVAKGLLEKFGPERVRETPLNEELLVGVALGAACMGLHPIIEYVHGTFLFAAANDIHRMGFLSGQNQKKFHTPMVIRVLFGGGYDNYDIELGFSPVSAFLNWHGIKMVCPSNAFQARGLLASAVASREPVIFLEHRALYDHESEVPEESYILPLSRARIAKEGNDLTIISFGYLLELALQSASEAEGEGISIEVIDLVSFKPIDEETILKSAAKTSRVLILDEEPARAGLHSLIASILCKELPSCKIYGLGSVDLPVLGRFSLLNRDKITTEVMRVLNK